MKRVLVALSLLMMIFGITAFQCSSTELTSAKLYIQQNKYDKAMESLKAEVTKNPKSDEGFYLLGYLYGEQKDYDKMLENYDKSLAISKTFEKDIEQSKKFHWADNYNRGVGLFNKASRITDVDSAKIVFQETIDAFENSIKCQSDSVDSYLNLAYAYLNLGDYNSSISPLKKVLELNKSAEAYSRLGDVYLTIGSTREQAYSQNKIAADSVSALENYNKAIDILDEGYKAFPNDPAILQSLANAYIGAKKLDIAMNTFKSLVDSDPDNASYRYNYGSLLLNANMFEEAVPQFEKAIELDSTSTNSIYNLAVTYVKWGAKLREADLNDGDDQESTEYLDKFKAALPYLEKYTQTEEGLTNKAMWELLGKVYLNLGMTEKSTEAYDKADKL